MSKTDTETWVPVDGFPLYAVSDQGRVMNVKFNRIVEGYVREDGNRYVSIANDTERRVVPIHVLVAENFSLGFVNRKRRQVVRRKDGDPENNSFQNLSYKNNRVVQRDIPPHESLKRRYIEIVETGERFLTVFDVAEHLGVAVPSIYRVLNGHRPHIGGRKLKYVWDS